MELVKNTTVKSAVSINVEDAQVYSLAPQIQLTSQGSRKRVYAGTSIDLC